PAGGYLALALRLLPPVPAARRPLSLLPRRSRCPRSLPVGAEGGAVRPGRDACGGCAVQRGPGGGGGDGGGSGGGGAAAGGRGGDGGCVQPERGGEGACPGRAGGGGQPAGGGAAGAVGAVVLVCAWAVGGVWVSEAGAGADQ